MYEKTKKYGTEGRLRKHIQLHGQELHQFTRFSDASASRNTCILFV